MPLDDRTFDLVLLSNWEDQIVYEPTHDVKAPAAQLTGPENDLTTPINKELESGAWTQSIIWSPKAPFRDFTQIEFNYEDDVVPEERTGAEFSQTYGCILTDRLSQLKPCGQENASERMVDKSKTSSTCRTIISTRSRKTVASTVSVRPLASSSWSMRIRLKSYNYHL